MAWLVLACVAVAEARPAAAQRVREVQLQIDNDNFNFWLHRTDRPDYEYTHGAWLTVTTAAAPWWGPRLAPALSACGSPGGDGIQRCLLTAWELGQHIYTPRINSPEPIAGQRPHAGWLYAAATAIAQRAADRHSVRLDLGVTGRPSLAGTMQRAVHRIGGYWEPLGWEHQLGFEPGVILGYRYDRAVAAAAIGEVPVARFAASGGAAAGNIWTGARAGLDGRIGLNAPRFWSPELGASPRVAIYAAAGVEADAVLRNLFLDGSTARPSPRVDKLPLVARYYYGGTARIDRWDLSVRVTTRGREYGTEPGGHTYTTFAATLYR